MFLPVYCLKLFIVLFMPFQIARLGPVSQTICVRRLRRCPGCVVGVRLSGRVAMSLPPCRRASAGPGRGAGAGRVERGPSRRLVSAGPLGPRGAAPRREDGRRFGGFGGRDGAPAASAAQRHLCAAPTSRQVERGKTCWPKHSELCEARRRAVLSDGSDCEDAFGVDASSAYQDSISV